MPSDDKHRKTIRHFDNPGDHRELTFSCVGRRPLLLLDGLPSLLTQSIDRAVENMGFRLVSFVYMPEHVHLLVIPDRPVTSVASLLHAIKRPSSFRIKEHLQKTDPARAESLMIEDRSGSKTFRFWQAGPGFDRNLMVSTSIYAAIDYLHNNPVRRGLVGKAGEWKWSSWHHYNGSSSALGLPRVHGLR